ncbi:hypothetical protein R9C00_10980 [Flammeovirgaceae bacterium SG7u.111]|nr:hypothetical protein [Flammeovirgaceae bacterium SG7u.132]WPO37974.1 hypothetical protein R9C00_10980 [Flammeovirgaceae bacterium SG7u.111]
MKRLFLLPIIILSFGLQSALASFSAEYFVLAKVVKVRSEKKFTFELLAKTKADLFDFSQKSDYLDYQISYTEDSATLKKLYAEKDQILIDLMRSAKCSYYLNPIIQKIKFDSLQKLKLGDVVILKEDVSASQFTLPSSMWEFVRVVDSSIIKKMDFAEWRTPDNKVYTVQFDSTSIVKNDIYSARSKEPGSKVSKVQSLELTQKDSTFQVNVFLRFLFDEEKEGDREPQKKKLVDALIRVDDETAPYQCRSSLNFGTNACLKGSDSYDPTRYVEIIDYKDGILSLGFHGGLRITEKSSERRKPYTVNFSLPIEGFSLE